MHTHTRARARSRSASYDLGRARNVRQIFGSNNWLCLLPVYTSIGNGVDFPRQAFHGGIVAV